jgi:DNA-binding transcriptional ArsR family regulator
MVKYSEVELDAIFAALSDPTRRKVLASLSGGPRPVTELAQPHGMSLPGFLKHLRILEDAGLIERLKEGRVVRCTLTAEPLQEAVVWLSHYRRFWTERLDALARFLYHQEEIQQWRKPRSVRRSRSSASSAQRRTRSGAQSRSRKG